MLPEIKTQYSSDGVTDGKKNEELFEQTPSPLPLPLTI